MPSHRKLSPLNKALAQASSYAEWLSIAEDIDTKNGQMAWRARDASAYCHEKLMRKHIQRMQTLRQNNDLNGLATLLQESIYRHLGELNNPELYQHALSGTKYIVTEYLDEVEKVMRTISGQTIPNMPVSRQLALFEQAARIYGCPALMLSGGAAFGIYHLGVIKALWEQNLLPQVLAGSSMGSIIAAAVCNKSDAELDLFFKEQLYTIHLDALRWRNPRDVREKGTAMDEQQLLEHILTNVGSVTFAEAYKRSGRILNITVSPTRTHQKPRVLNYLTAPDVLVEYAALASCAVPLLFPAVSLQARGKNGQHVPYMSTEKWIDGAVHGDLPRERLARLHNVNQTIVSQANPHIIPFITHRNQRGVRAFSKQVLSSLIHVISAEVLDVGRHLMHKTPLNPVFTQAHAVASQSYIGDMNIQFPFHPAAYLKVISNPTPATLAHYIRLGEQATWPQVAMIRDMTRISRLFPECIAQIKARMAGMNRVDR
jgi:TAG lipase/steryl ester hydrolase/phospholipase A2/LPA acyltransferase